MSSQRPAQLQDVKGHPLPATEQLLGEDRMKHTGWQDSRGRWDCHLMCGSAKRGTQGHDTDPQLSVLGLWSEEAV